MLNKLSGALPRFAKGWLVLVLFILDIVFMMFIMPIAGALLQGDAGGVGPMDLQLFYSPATAFRMIASYGDYGRIMYRNVELSLDIIYPIIYTLAYSLMITYFFQRAFDTNSNIQRLNLLPFGAWLFDLLENMGIVTLLSVYPAQPMAVAALTGIFTSVKWFFAFASILAVLVGLGGLIIRKLKK